MKDEEVPSSRRALRLSQLRERWLNPPEWVKEEVLECPGATDGPWARYAQDPGHQGIGTVNYPRQVAKDQAAAEKLAQRTLTNLYNQSPTWLQHAHQHLDEAVAAAYGWPPDLTEEQILERLLALNLERAGEVGAVTIGDSEPAVLLTQFVGPSIEARAAGETRQGLNQPERLRRSFWALLLDRAQPTTTLHSAVSPGP